MSTRVSKITVEDIFSAAKRQGISFGERAPSGSRAKVFISSLGWEMTAEFRDRLVVLNRTTPGGILARADLIGAMPADLVSASEISDAGGIAKWHFVLVPEAASMAL